MAVTRTKEITVADAWGNDVGGVTVEVGKGRAHLSVDEACAFSVLLVDAANEALRATREQFDAERSLAEYRDRMALDGEVEDVIR